MYLSNPRQYLKYVYLGKWKRWMHKYIGQYGKGGLEGWVLDLDII